jgi:hypothetical protein
VTSCPFTGTPLAAKMAYELRMPNKKYVLKINWKPRSGNQLVTSFPDCDVIELLAGLKIVNNFEMICVTRKVSTNHSYEVGVGLSNKIILSARGASVAVESNLRE